jgi:hypothetical protein
MNFCRATRITFSYFNKRLVPIPDFCQMPGFISFNKQLALYYNKKLFVLVKNR